MNLSNNSPDRVEVELAVRTYCGTQKRPGWSNSDHAIGLRGQRGAWAAAICRSKSARSSATRCSSRMSCTVRQTDGRRVGAGACRWFCEFDGGYLEGRRFDSQSDNVYEALLAVAYYHLTDQGTVGERLRRRSRHRSPARQGRSRLAACRVAQGPPISRGSADRGSRSRCGPVRVPAEGGRTGIMVNGDCRAGVACSAMPRRTTGGPCRPGGQGLVEAGQCLGSDC